MTTISKIKNRVKGMIARALIKAIDDSTEVQLAKIKIYGDELQDGVERIQNFGFTSNPPIDSEAVIIYVGGAKDNPVIICCDGAASRVANLSPGESAQYSAHGHTIRMRENGNIEITMPGTTNVGNGDDFVALAAKVDASITAIEQALVTSATATGDGGATYRSNITAYLSGNLTPIGSVASSNLRADE